MSKKYKNGLILIVILIVLVTIIGVSKVFFKKENSKKPENKTSIISNITDFGYTLDDRDTKYMKDTWKELEKILKEKEIDYDKYAESLAKLFIIDLYTLNNKINKYDVGSLEYILSDKQEMFKTKVMDTIYNDLIDNTYNDRVQELPEITNIEIINNEKTEITLNDQKIPSYKITMKYEYEKDLKYDKEGTVYLVQEDNKLAVAQYKPTIE